MLRLQWLGSHAEVGDLDQAAALAQQVEGKRLARLQVVEAETQVDRFAAGQQGQFR